MLYLLIEGLYLVVQKLQFLRQSLCKFTNLNDQRHIMYVKLTTISFEGGIGSSFFSCRKKTRNKKIHVVDIT